MFIQWGTTSEMALCMQLLIKFRVSVGFIVCVVLRGTRILPWPRLYHFPTVPVTSPLRYFLVPQYHKYRGSSAQYLSVVDTQ